MPSCYMKLHAHLAGVVRGGKEGEGVQALLEGGCRVVTGHLLGDCLHQVLQRVPSALQSVHLQV